MRWLIVAAALFPCNLIGVDHSGDSATSPEAPKGAAIQFEGVREFIRKRMVEEQVPSVAVAVAKDGKIVWEEGFGWADRERRIPATEHTLYSVASITKPITATGLMVLKERGKLDLDRPINDYLGDAKLKAWLGDAREATVRRVANHTAGLPLHFQFFFEDEPDRPPSMDETILRYGNLVTRPGEVFQYSNVGYGILSYLIERLSGRSYVDFLKREVFLPLGMTRTCVDLEPQLREFAAVRYGTDGRPLPFYAFDHPGASAVFSSAHDLVRFGLFHAKARAPDQKAILSDAGIEEMQRPMSPAAPDQLYSVGWFMGKTKTGQSSVAHSGGMDGVSTRLYVVPKDGVVLVVLSNADSELPGEIFREIMPVLYGEAARDKPSPQPQAPAGPASRFRPSKELIGTWSGLIHTYAGDIPLTLEIRVDGDMHAKAGNGLWTLLNDAGLEGNLLTGRMTGSVGTPDAARLPYDLRLSLRLRQGGALNGVVTARSLPGKRLGNALSYWTELRKSATARERQSPLPPT
jgi:CubicO group peptidase (beta-lactamase class C family)